MELNRIYLDSDFSNTVVPDGQRFLFLGYYDGIEGSEIVIRYKDSDGNFGNIASGSSGKNEIIEYFYPTQNKTIEFENTKFPCGIKTATGKIFPILSDTLSEVENKFVIDLTNYLVLSNEEFNSNIQYGVYISVGGIKGNDGIGISFKGAYSNSTTYSCENGISDAVQYEGSLWGYVNSTPTAGNLPPTLPQISNEYWTLLVQKGESSNLDINKFVITRPVSDEQLYPKFEASETKDFTNAISVDPINNSSDSQYLQVFDGSNWIDFPTNGLGTPFDRMEVSVDVSKFENLNQPYYIRYCWVMSDGTESNFRSALFPSVSVSGSSSGEGGGNITVDNALAYEDITDLIDNKFVPTQGGFPVWVLSPKNNLYPIEKDTMILENGIYKVNASKYLGYEGTSVFTGTWRVYFAGGVKGEEGKAGKDGQNYNPDVKDVLSNRSKYDNEKMGFCFLAIDEANIYFKLSDNYGDWTEAIPVTVGPEGKQGIKGDKGDATVVTIGDNGNWYLDGVDTGKKATGQGSNAVLSATPPTDVYDGMIWIQIESSEDNQFINFESVDVVVGTTEPTDAPDGTIFIQE